MNVYVLTYGESGDQVITGVYASPEAAQQRIDEDVAAWAGDDPGNASYPESPAIETHELSD